MQDEVIHDITTGWSTEKEYNLLLAHVIAAERVALEDKLSFQGRQALIIKKVNHMLLKNKNKIKEGKLMIKMPKDDKAIEVLVVLSQTRLEWYAMPKMELTGFVNLQSISKVCVPKKYVAKVTDDSQPFTFKVQCAKWEKEGIVGSGLSGKLLFSSISSKTKYKQDAQDWNAYIDYLKTKVTFDQFVNKYGKVNFPL